MRVAITGGIAEGKSTVLTLLAQRGFSTASADEVARTVFRDPETNACLAAIIGSEAPISGAELGSAIATDPILRREVNAVMHPMIAAELRRIGAAFDEVPLLIEACRYGDYDAVWTATCAPAEKARRLVVRYGEEGAATFATIAHQQVSSRVRAAFADQVIRTDGDMAETKRQVEAALAEWIIAES